MGKYDFEDLLTHTPRFSISRFYFVDKYMERIGSGKHPGLMVKAIVDELKRGAYWKNDTWSFFEAPNFMCVKELLLSSFEIKTGYGKADYHPHKNNSNWFPYWYCQNGGIYEGDSDNAKTRVDGNCRGIIMPTIPGFDYVLRPSTVGRNDLDSDEAPNPQKRGPDGKFSEALDLQEKDPGFQFQGTNGLVKFKQTQVEVRIREDNWTFVFPWSDVAEASTKGNNHKLLAMKANDELKDRLKKISYHINTDKPGLQTIILPAAECPVDLSLDCTVRDVTWLIVLSSEGHSDQSSLEETVRVQEDRVKIGNEQDIRLMGNDARVLLVVPKSTCTSTGTNTIGSLIAYVEPMKKAFKRTINGDFACASTVTNTMSSTTAHEDPTKKKQRMGKSGDFSGTSSDTLDSFIAYLEPMENKSKRTFGKYGEFSDFSFRIPGSYFVDKYVERVKNTKHTGLLVKAIVDELKCGAFQKSDCGNFLEGPNFMCVRELNLSCSYVKARYGKADYHPHKNNSNWFTYWYRQEGGAYEGNPNYTRIWMDSKCRGIIVPTIPGFDYILTPSTGPLAGRNDVEFSQALALQNCDPGFQFQGAEGHIKSKQTQVGIRIREDDWTFIFPWSDLTEASAKGDDHKVLAMRSNDELKDRLKMMSYHINTDKPGRQTIVLPAAECPIDVSLDSTVTGVTWCIILSNEGHSDPLAIKETIKLEDERIKVGTKQSIRLVGKDAHIYLIIPKSNIPDSHDSSVAYESREPMKCGSNKSSRWIVKIVILSRKLLDMFSCCSISDMQVKK